MYRFNCSVYPYIKGFLYVVLFYPIASSALAPSPLNITIVTESLPPLQFEDDNGEAKGAMVELVEAIIDDAGIQGEIKVLPWARAFQIAKTYPNTLIFSIMKTPKRQPQFNWIGTIYHANVYLIKLKRLQHLQLNTIKDALKYKVGVIRLDISQEYLLGHGFRLDENLLTSVGYQGLWQLLYKNNIDFLLANKFMWQLEASDPSLNNQPIEIALELKDFATNYYLATSKNTSPEITKKLTESLEKIKKSGQYQSILAKWQLD
ncbi:substrate-binding periplasmic protein [Thalassotalea atypica]|uniref:substrate-binding periplasmic protein n=1 Tax=Thalassotalea atypica TaxID=2054316 RepID=UPI0025742C66|nr:transporter substrate-binding domain-containing protein [Thalassotalea atypica]